MGDERTIPVAAAHREFVVKVDGQPVSREHQLLAVTVVKEVNRLAWARLTYQDGAAAAGDFRLASAATFVPGAVVEILAGPVDQPATLFQGVVIRQALRARERGSSQLIIECRHRAFRLSVDRKSACFLKQRDSEVLETLLTDAGLGAKVEATAVQHAQLVQFRSSDWDFLLARAGANGKLVLTNDDRVVIKAPAAGAPVMTLQFGATILELDAEIDARTQFSGVKAVTWDPAQQALREHEAAEPALQAPGDLKEADLAAVAGQPPRALRHAALADDEAQAWANAERQRAALCRVKGRVKCEGLSAVNPGDTVTLAGVGPRFSGAVFVTGVRHDSGGGETWKTHVQFGGLPGPAAAQDVAAPAAGALVPGLRGLQIASVVSNVDPEGEHRVRVRLPLEDHGSDGIFARVASLDAGSKRGFFFRPEVDDEVIVGFLDDDPRRAVILGMLHSSAKPAPLTGSEENHEKVLQSRSRLRVYFHDDKKLLQLETPAGNKVALSEADKGILIADQSGNSIKLAADGITITSKKALVLKAETTAVLEAQQACNVKGGTELKLSGTSAAELSCTATTSIKGAPVKLN